MNAAVYALAFDANDNLYVDGHFTTAGGASANGIVKWTGSGWRTLGSGVRSSGWDATTIYAVLPVGDQVYLGGSFTMAGLYPSLNIARWSGSPQSYININHTTGKPGSYFTIGGWGFPANSNATISLNGQALSPALTTNASGGVTFRLNTSQLTQGMYRVKISVNPSASVAFVLDESAPLRPLTGAGSILNPSAGISPLRAIFLPCLER